MEGGGCSLHLFPWVDAVTDAGASGLGAALAQGAVVHLDEGKKNSVDQMRTEMPKGWELKGKTLRSAPVPGRCTTAPREVDPDALSSS